MSSGGRAVGSNSIDFMDANSSKSTKPLEKVGAE